MSRLGAGSRAYRRSPTAWRIRSSAPWPWRWAITTMMRRRTCSSRVICFAVTRGGSLKPRRARASCCAIAPPRPRSAITTTMDGSTCTSRPAAGGGPCFGTWVGAGFGTSRPRRASRRPGPPPGRCSWTSTTTGISTSCWRHLPEPAPIAITWTARSGKWPVPWGSPAGAAAGAGELRRRLRGLAAWAAAFSASGHGGFLVRGVGGKPPAPPAGGRGVFLFRNDPTRGFEDSSSILPDSLRAGRAVAVADVDQDGDLDLIVVGWDGRPRLLRNDGGNVNQYVKVRLVGLREGSGKNNTFGLGATLELRAGDLYQLRLVSDRVTHFGLGRRLKADVLRVRWPNGVSQTVYYPGTEEDVLEQQILKGSCPFLYAWDGRGFSFVTDVMWRSALGMPLGIMAGGTDIASAPPHASREYMRVPGDALVPRDGRYVLQMTEELWETGYLDAVKLLAVDHPDSVDVYVNEGFVPPAPGPAELRLYTVPRSSVRPLVAATDEQGTDWLPALRARDDRYVAPLTLTRYQGIATLHDLILDFGDLSGLESEGG